MVDLRQLTEHVCRDLKFGERWLRVFTLLVTVVTAGLFGLAPATTVGRANLEEMLREDGKGASSSGRQHRLCAVLVSVEIDCGAFQQNVWVEPRRCGSEMYCLSGSQSGTI